MNFIDRSKAISFFLIAACLMAACDGTLPSSATSVQSSKVQTNTVGLEDGLNHDVNDYHSRSGQNSSPDGG